MTKYPNRNTTTMKTIKINNNLVKINYDGTVIMINEGRSVPASIAPKKKHDPVKIDPAQVLELWRKGFKPHSIAQHTGGRISKIEEILEQSRRKLHYITGR